MYMFMQTFIDLSAGVHELSWSQRKKLRPKQYRHHYSGKQKYVKWHTVDIHIPHCLSSTWLTIPNVITYTSWSTTYTLRYDTIR